MSSPSSTSATATRAEALPAIVHTSGALPCTDAWRADFATALGPKALPWMGLVPAMQAVSAVLIDGRFRIDMMKAHVDFVEYAWTAAATHAAHLQATATLRTREPVEKGTLLAIDVSVFDPVAPDTPLATLRTNVLERAPHKHVRADTHDGQTARATLHTPAAVGPLYAAAFHDDTPLYTDAPLAHMAGLPGPIAPALWVLLRVAATFDVPNTGVLGGHLFQPVLSDIPLSIYGTEDGSAFSVDKAGGVPSVRGAYIRGGAA